MGFRMEITMAVPPLLDTEVGDLKKNALKLAHDSAGRGALEWFIGKRLQRRVDRNRSTARELGWQARDPKYNLVKQRVKKSGWRDHYWSGKARREVVRVVRGGAVSSMVTPKRLRVVIGGLGKQYRPGMAFFGKPDLNAELSRVGRHELSAMAIVYGREYARFLNEDPRARRKTTRKVKAA